MLWFYDFSNHYILKKERKKNKSSLLTTGDIDMQIDCKKVFNCKLKWSEGKNLTISFNLLSSIYFIGLSEQSFYTSYVINYHRIFNSYFE